MSVPTKARPPLRVTALQLAARWADVDHQLAQVDALLSNGPPTDLVLLPEASLTGYVSPEGSFDLSPFAEGLDDLTPRALAHLARKHRVHLVGPFLERDAEDSFNAMVGFTPDGEFFVRYRKRHPWYPETWASPGEERLPLVTVLGHTITVAICFDLHYLPDDSAPRLEAADLLLFPSAWVEDVDTRPEMLDALSRRFHLAIVNANWAPGDVQVPGQGRSVIFGPDGAVLAQAGLEPGRIDATLP